MTRYLDENSGKQIVIETNKGLALKANQAYVDTKFGNMGNTKTFKGSCLFSALPATGATVDDYWYVTDQTTNYCYNGTTWENIGNNFSLGDGTITPKKLSFIPNIAIKSVNLFDKNTVIANSYIEANGGVALATNHYASDWIPILSSTTYYKNVYHSVAFYDTNKSFISSSVAGVNAITSPSNAKYCRFTINPMYSLDFVQLSQSAIELLYESYTPKVNINTIKNKSITTDMLNFTPIVGTPSINLFDKSKVTAGKYVKHNDRGNLGTLASMSASDWIPVTENTTYTQSGTRQLAFYNSAKGFISGLPSGNTFTTPLKSAFVRLSVYNTELNSFQLELGSIKTTYQSFLPTIKKEQIIDLGDNTIGKNIITVGVNCRYSTITEAIDSVIDSSSTNRYTILISAGEYEEQLSIQDKYIDLVALNLGSVKIFERVGAYRTPPIEMSSKNNLYNLIIESSNENYVADDTGEPAYAIHHDYTGAGTNYIKNCVLISHQSCAFGCGSHQSQNINLIDCDIITTVSSPHANGRPALLYHPYPYTATNQSLTLKNCRLKTNNGKVISIIDSNNNDLSGGTKDNRDTVCNFYNNSFWSEMNGKTDILYAPDVEITQVGCIDGYIKLGNDSFGNNVELFNA